MKDEITVDDLYTISEGISRLQTELQRLDREFRKITLRVAQQKYKEKQGIREKDDRK